MCVGSWGEGGMGVMVKVEIFFKGGKYCDILENSSGFGGCIKMSLVIVVVCLCLCIYVLLLVFISLKFCWSSLKLCESCVCEGGNVLIWCGIGGRSL